MARLTEYFFKSLPDYFYLYDSYKANDPALQDRGLLERYMLAFQEDGEVIDLQITEMANLPFPLETPEDYLSFIAGLYGLPPDTFQDIDWYRQLLRNIIDINKVRGTEEGIVRFFGIMGTDVDITITHQDRLFYDDGVTYYDTDVGQPDPVYYDSTCFPCSDIVLNIVGPLTPIASPPYDTNLKLAIQSILVYLFPINLRLDEFQYAGGVQDIYIPIVDGVDRNLIKFTP